MTFIDPTFAGLSANDLRENIRAHIFYARHATSDQLRDRYISHARANSRELIERIRAGISA